MTEQQFPRILPDMSNTAKTIEHMELYGQEAETEPATTDIQDAVHAEMNGIWTRLGHRNRVYNDEITNRGEEKLAWYVRSLETAAKKANKELDRAEYMAAPYEGERSGTEMDNRIGDEALNNKHVAVSYFSECDEAFTYSLLVHKDLTGNDWLRPAEFTRNDAKVIVTAEQHAVMTGIPAETTAARAKYK